jgi:hypothetical protein
MPEKGHHLSRLKNFQESKIPVILNKSLIDKTVRVPDAPPASSTSRRVMSWKEFALPDYDFNASARSRIRSSGSSRPTERRTKPSVIPRAIRSSSGMEPWDMVAG